MKRKKDRLRLGRSNHLKLGCVGLLLWVVLGLIGFAPEVEAAKIGEITETQWTDQAVRFFSFRDPSVRYAVLGSVFLGISCGLLGSFILVRKLALMGDALSHAVLPGVALGFLWNMTKDPVAIFVGATVAGLLGTVTVNLIKETTAIKEDSALGMVLAGFYGLGICLFTMIQNLPSGNKAGIDKYLFGQAAALSSGDIVLMGSVMLVACLLIMVFYKELLVTSFDSEFAVSLGIPARVFHYLIMLLLAFSVVVALQAVGVVLVSAMLITPAATAYLLTDRLHRMLILAAFFGMLAGLLGAFFSFLGNNLPTGPFMVLGASVVFFTAFLLAPRYGLLPRWWKRFNRSRRIQIENTLKAFYQVREADGFVKDGVTLDALSSRRNEPLHLVEKQVENLVRDGLASFDQKPESELMLTQDSVAYLTPVGWQRACEIVRNHRLWELYLTNAAEYEADHVHDDAEIIEHILGAETVRLIERKLDFPTRDPHGKLIPSAADMGEVGLDEREAATGYFRNI